MKSLVSASLFTFVLAATPDLAFRGEWRVPSRKASVANPVPSDAASLERGSQLYAMECAGCHGATGSGDGPRSAELDREVASFSSPLIAKQPDGALFYKITIGRNPMPGYRQMYEDQDRWHLVNFIRSLVGVPLTHPSRPSGPERRGAISRTMGDYARIHEALLQEERGGWAAGVTALSESVSAMEQVQESLPDSESKAAWDACLENLERVATSLSETQNAAAQTAAFAALSECMLGLLRDFGHAQEDPVCVFQVQSPAGDGAHWIQVGGEARDPFGTVPLKSSLVEHLAGTPSSPEDQRSKTKSEVGT